MVSSPGRRIRLSLQHADITTVPADVVALKYAQGFYGADAAVARALPGRRGSTLDIEPAVGEHRLVSTHGSIRAPRVLFVGVPPLNDFRYPQIRDFARRVLAILATESPDVESVALTIHGPGYGLDEVEAFDYELNGIADAIRAGLVPQKLANISIVESSERRVERLGEAMLASLAAAGLNFDVEGSGTVSVNTSATSTTPTGNDADISTKTLGGIQPKKPQSVFVAMPFSKEMDDVFHYGIQNPVHDAGYIVERMDQVPFTGDILAEIKRRIETSTIVIADLTEDNPNVYLEVGYAWGRGKPTILLERSGTQAKFDVSGQKWLIYDRIKDLEEKLKRELDGLGLSG